MQRNWPSLTGSWRAAVAAAVLLVLGIGAGGAGTGEAESGKPESGVSVTARQTGEARKPGEDFKFRRGLGSVKNPYCEIVTYVVRDLPTGASSTQDGAGRAVIVIDAGALKTEPDYAQFLLAHECCHHSLGHIRARTQNPSRLGPQPFYYLLPRLKAVELEADTCAVRTLKAVGAGGAIESARAHMLTFGNDPTGAHYPTGVERADNIARIAVEK
jgi:hypothetical protein